MRKDFGNKRKGIFLEKFFLPRKNRFGVKNYKNKIFAENIRIHRHQKSFFF